MKTKLIVSILFFASMTIGTAYMLADWIIKQQPKVGEVWVGTSDNPFEPSTNTYTIVATKNSYVLFKINDGELYSMRETTFRLIAKRAKE